VRKKRKEEQDLLKNEEEAAGCDNKADRDVEDTSLFRHHHSALTAKAVATRVHFPLPHYMWHDLLLTMMSLSVTLEISTTVVIRNCKSG